MGVARPLALVSSSPIEKRTTLPTLDNAVRTYHMAGVKQLLGLSFKEYLELSVDECYYLLQSLADVAKSDARDAEKTYSDLTSKFSLD